mmetsp:Transcript_9388/g.8874  ORF Transcript_9388/g.8874 Transcript_9388/m.8874 type:complete len:155 (+) Transcript_9388:994-1458(+)
MQETCWKCPDNCAACTYDAYNDAPFCYACADGYYYNLEEARCVPKEDEDCGLGMYYSGYDCEYCSYGCADCGLGYGCEDCFEDYVLYYDSWFGESACQYCAIDNCDRCSISGFFQLLTCEECSDGYKRNFFGRCVWDSNLVECDPGEYLDRHEH